MGFSYFDIFFWQWNTLSQVCILLHISCLLFWKHFLFPSLTLHEMKSHWAFKTMSFPPPTIKANNKQKGWKMSMLTYHEPFSKNTFNFPRDDFPSKDFTSDIVFFKKPWSSANKTNCSRTPKKRNTKVVRDFIGSPAEVRKVTQAQNKGSLCFIVVWNWIHTLPSCLSDISNYLRKEQADVLIRYKNRNVITNFKMGTQYVLNAHVQSK